MIPYPFKDAAAKSGSNIPGNPLLAHRKKVLAARNEAHERLAREERRRLAGLLTKRELGSLRKLAAAARNDMREAIIDCGGDVAAIAAARAAARRKLDRAFAREAPGYSRWRTVRRAALRAHGKLLDAQGAAAPGGRDHLAWGNVGVRPADPLRTFVPPFTTFDVQMINFGDEVIRDDSFARPQIGHLVNNFDYDDDQDTSIVAGAFGILPPNFATSRAMCGAGFTTPASGFLEMAGVFRNVYYRAMLSVEDSAGFSSAVTGISVGFCFTILRGNGDVIEASTTLRNARLDSGGGDGSIVDTGIDDQTPITASVLMPLPLDANESVLVLAGAEVTIASMLDDMHCRGNALAWWMLSELRVGRA
jgi:hypothetical protein